MNEFAVWINQFKDAHSPFGDLANDIANDKNFPNTNDYNVLRTYLENTAALGTFELAWQHYTGQIDTKIAHHQLGARLKFIRTLLMSIHLTPEINDILRGNDSCRIWNMTNDALDNVRSNMDTLIFNEEYEWANTNVYYNSSTSINDLLNTTLAELDIIAKTQANSFSSPTA